MLGQRFKDQEHLLRVAALFVGGLLLFLFLKAVLVPKGFGTYGHYRAGALEDARARPVAFAGAGACADCHSDVLDDKKAGKHAGVRCEACHGPLASHAQADDPAAAKPKRPTAELCLVCHAGNVAKQAGFPQVQTKEHAEPGTCLECHKGHQPGV
jgi:Cytochrome c7 and related cytochrome c